MLYDTVTEYTEEITRVRNAIKRNLLVGQHSKNVTNTTERSMSEVDIDKLQAYLKQLLMEKRQLTSTLGGRTVGAGW